MLETELLVEAEVCRGGLGVGGRREWDFLSKSNKPTLRSWGRREHDSCRLRLEIEADTCAPTSLYRSKYELGQL